MKDMIKEIDNLILEKKESINFEEFVDLYGIDESLEPTSKEEIKKVFDSFVNDSNSNVITFDTLKKISIELGDDMSDEEIMDMIKNASKNGKMEITFEDFYEMMTKKLI